MTAAQALGLLVQVLRISGAGSYGCGGLQQQPEALAALGGTLLLHRRPTERCAAPSLLQLPSVAAGAASTAGAKDAACADVDGDDGNGLEDPTSRSWGAWR
jgi:hypothetical protein